MSEVTPKQGPESNPDARTITIKVRVNREEKRALDANSKRKELAAWMRDVCLAAGQVDMLDELLPPTVDPELLRQLAGAGNLLNQIARALHKPAVTPEQRIAALASITQVEADLAAIRKAYTAT